VNAADIFARWDDIDRLPEANRNAIDDMRWLPVAETRELLRRASTERWFGDRRRNNDKQVAA
jgi:hypothetical protein